jgi:hypothetical protein
MIFSLTSFNSQVVNPWDHEKIEVNKNGNKVVIVGVDAIFKDKWHDLPQPNFWKQIMLLSPDSCLINIADNRLVLEKKSFLEWRSQTEVQKSRYKDSLRKIYDLNSNVQINVTSGKNDFYKFEEVYPSISKGVAEFEKYGVDPWYAQAILLIESPGQLIKSNVGAYGAFQLMPSVARSQGLIVTKTVDERKDFEKSAMGSAKLISRICIPEAKKILNDYHISYNENDLWFRLFVLHVYHAGAMNVKAVVNKIQPTIGSQDLILKMWQTSAASFGNSSQNYSQLALASQLILNDMVVERNNKINFSEPNQK